MTAPTVIQGQRIVCIRQYTAEIGLGLRVRMWGAFDLHGGRTRLSPPLTNRLAVAAWVGAQGWRYVGPQEAVAVAS